jgi:hypothetical protein
MPLDLRHQPLDGLGLVGTPHPRGQRKIGSRGEPSGRYTAIASAGSPTSASTAAARCHLLLGCVGGLRSRSLAASRRRLISTRAASASAAPIRLAAASRSISAS